MWSRLSVRRVIGFGLIMVLLAVSIQAVWAALVMGSASFTCSSVTFSFDNDASGGADEAVVTVTNLSTGTTLYDSTGSFLFSPFGGGPFTVNFAPQANGSTLQLTIQVSTRIVSASAVCAASSTAVSGDTPICDDGRINRYNCEPVAIYPVKTDAGYDMVIYKDIPDGNGVLPFSVSAADLAALPSHPESPLLVATSPDGFASLYWLPSNEYQIIAGPDSEGKMFKFIFRNFPGEEPRLITYLAGGE